MGFLAWLKVIAENGQTIGDIVRECFRDWFSGMGKHPARSVPAQSSGD
jgi:hypothetical protein